MKNGFDSHRYGLVTGGRQTTQDWDYSSSRRSVKRRRREDDEEIHYGRSSNRRKEESRCSRGDIPLDISYCQSSNRKRRREEGNNISGRSSSRRRIEECNSRRDVSLLEINCGRSSFRRDKVDDDNNISLNFRSSYRRRREGSSKNNMDDGRSVIKEDTTNVISNRREDSSKNNMDDGRSVIKKDTTNVMSNSKRVDVSEFYKEDDDEINATPVGSFPCYVDDGIVMEILSRLPAKSLLRFKSVCKHWLSLITQDQHFIHLHSIRSKSRPNLLCIAPKPQKEETETLTQGILSAKLSVKTTGGEAKVITHNFKKTTDDNWFNYDMVLGPVNGLVCFVHWDTAAARIYNVSTRKVTPWVRSTLLAEEKGKFESEDNPLKLVSNFLPIYQFGFDPEKKEHKVFCFWRLSATDDSPFIRFYSDSDSSYASWEAFTVGRDTEWRRISVVPDENNLIKINEVLPSHCWGKTPVHANGTIYWRNKLKNLYEGIDDSECGPRDYESTDPDVIIAFDVGSEKFRVIPIPSFILDDPREKMFNRAIAMLILGGRVTLIYALSCSILKLCMLDDGVEKKLENCQGKGSGNWSTETITLPCDFDTGCLGFHGVPTSSDKILISVLIPTYGIDGGRHDKMSCLYSYDRKRKTLEEIEMDGIFSIPPLHHGRSLFTTYTESLVPVLPQQDRNR